MTNGQPTQTGNYHKYYGLNLTILTVSQHFTNISVRLSHNQYRWCPQEWLAIGIPATVSQCKAVSHWSITQHTTDRTDDPTVTYHGLCVAVLTASQYYIHCHALSVCLSVTKPDRWPNNDLQLIFLSTCSGSNCITVLHPLPCTVRLSVAHKTGQMTQQWLTTDIPVSV